MLIYRLKQFDHRLTTALNIDSLRTIVYSIGGIPMKMYSPAVLEALAECLTTVYWYKQDLRSFLLRAGIPAEQVAKLDWGRYKRFVVSELLDQLATNPSTGTDLLGKLIGSVIEQDDTFSAPAPSG